MADDRDTGTEREEPVLERRAAARRRLDDADRHWTAERLEAAYEEHDRRLSAAA